MKKTDEIVLEVLKCAIHNQEFFMDAEVSDEEWMEVTETLARNRLLGVVYASKGIFVKQGPSAELIEGIWKKTAIMINIAQSVNNHHIYDVLDRAEREGVRLLVIKGMAIAALYPYPLTRYSCDADLYVEEQNKAKAIAVLEACGYQYVEKGSKDNVPVYMKDGSKIELHFRLWEDYVGTITDKLDAMNLTNEKKVIQMKDGKNYFYTLGYEEHLIFQIFHIAKHFSLEGVGLKYISDLTLYVNNYQDKINWKDFWNKMKILHYDYFCDALFKIANEYMGMTSLVLNAKYKNRKIDKALIEDIIIMGKVGENDQQPWRVMDKLMPYFLQESKVPVTRLEKIQAALFPNQAQLSDYYCYAKENKWLLPVAWVHRIFHSSNYKLHPTLEKEVLEMKSEKAERRMELMEKAGLNK